MSKIAKSMAVLGVVAGFGVAALPLSSYASESAPVTIQATVDSSIAVTAATDMVDLGTISAGSGIATQTTSVTVSGSVKKYNLGLVDKNTDTNMNWVSLAEGQTESESTITGTQIPATADLATEAKGWAFRLGEDEAWQAVPAYGTNTFNITPDGGADMDGSAKTDVTFGVKADATLKNGIYQDQVVFIATAAE